LSSSSTLTAIVSTNSIVSYQATRSSDARALPGKTTYTNGSITSTSA
jgi:hypothetical protein